LLTADPGEDIAAAWIAKEPPRELLSCAGRGGMRYEIAAALDRFLRFCAACEVPEFIKFARTIETWQEPIGSSPRCGRWSARSAGRRWFSTFFQRLAKGSVWLAWM